MTEPIHSGSIKTGTGGFNLAGKVYTYDVGVPDGQGGAQGDSSPGDIKVDHSVKDLSKPTKTTLADYLSNLTKGQTPPDLENNTLGVPNAYAVDSGFKEIKLSGDKGNPSPLPKTVTNTAAFAPTPPDPYSVDFPVIQPKIKKGKASAQLRDGHELLKGGDAEPIKSYRSAVLSKNRFTDAATLDSNSFGVKVTDQRTKGQYDPKAKAITQGQLASVGPILTMRAGIELGATDDGANPNSGGLAAKSLLPGVAQLAVSRVDEIVLNAKDVLDALTTDEPPDANIISPGSLSWGALNNTEDQYSGIAALGMAALSAALIAGLLLVIDLFSLILGLITPSSKAATHDAQGRYALGQYYAKPKESGGGLLGAATALLSLDIGSLLGIHKTNNPFGDCLKKGANAFFGIDDSGGVLGQLAGAVTDALGPDAGFNAIVARAIIRSSLTIVDQIKKIGGNPLNIIKQIMGLIEVLRASKIISACNVFAQLGDSILSIPENWTDPDALGSTKISQTDTSSVDSVIGRNRRPNSLKLAWASNRAPAQLLVPAQIAAVSRLGKKIGSYDPWAGTQNLDNRLYSQVTKHDAVPRIDPDTSALFEKSLEAEYVPFYFHDIRTNEIVAFHAFLTSLNDDYTANYESIDAYGRVEPVKIYKSTSRRIGVSFYIIATSSEDLDDMYVKINKLVTLVYPQFTSGKQLTDESKQFVFTQPFSQLIGASPLIRLRLGDLFRSNYSRFNLARLFGLGNTNFTVGGQKFTNFDKFDQDVLTATLPIALDDAKKEAGKLFIAQQGVTYVAQDEKSAIAIPNPLGGSSSGAEGSKSFTPTGVPDFFEIKIVKEIDDRNVLGEVQLSTDPEIMSILADKLDSIKAEYGSDDKKLLKVIGCQYVFPKKNLQPTVKTRDEVVDKIVGIAENDAFVQPLTDFMDPAKNVVAKSFKDAGGKGLAGFIDTMSFDWYDKVTWETQFKDRIVPKMCKVTLAFSPIHDIAPGLDHFGTNRAPVYPVGLLAPRSEPK